MRLTSFNYSSLRRHKVTEQQCLEVTDESNQSTEEFDQGYSQGGNWRIMFVGFTKDANLLEVGVEFIELSKTDTMITVEKYWKHVYHADYATLIWQKEYELVRKSKT